MRVKRLADCLKKLGRVSGLHSLILYGSLLRGDFVPGTSDVDFFAVLEDGTDPEGIIEKIKPALEECSAFLNPVEVDVAWEWLSNLHDPSTWVIPTSFSPFTSEISEKTMRYCSGRTWLASFRSIHLMNSFPGGWRVF